MNRLIHWKWTVIALFILFFQPIAGHAQTAYFADGFHGGTIGGNGYPEGYTHFMVKTFKAHPSWSMNLEIEPGTWDSVQVNHPAYYQEFKALLANPAYANRIDFVNPTVAQPYLWNISGESIIRQFQYGMQKIHQHFPGVPFSTYAAEEPCWTSSLPQILRSLGIKYAVLKNPNTAWAGYSRAYGGELVNWIGPDGTSIKAVPRYAVEKLKPGSTWQTIAFGNAKRYINACFRYGINHPIGMTFQDAGWTFGPWLGNAVKHYYKPTNYVTWTYYFEHIAAHQTTNDWHLNQEDLKVSLMWGSQVLNNVAQAERATNNNLLQAGKIASMATVFANAAYPDSALHHAWRNLLFSQHHDCWIVPYNIVPYYGENSHVTWADQVGMWTSESDSIAKAIIGRANRALSKGTRGDDAGTTRKYVRVYNTLGHERIGIASIAMPARWPRKGHIQVRNHRGNVVPSQVVVDPDTREAMVLFKAHVPPMGYATYAVTTGKTGESTGQGAHVTTLTNGNYLVETNLYKMVLNPAKGGTIQSLIGKKMGHKQFVDQSSGMEFNALRGYFYHDHRFYSSTDSPATISVIENGPLLIRLKIKGTIAASPFVQYVTLAQGQRRIDLRVHINWEGNPGIGKFNQTNYYEATDLVKAFYNDKYKLHVVFPLNLADQQVYKNAPFSVMKSQLKNTFFNRWDNIKNNIILNWVDVTDGAGQYGLALLSDHTTSYLHGQHYPLGLTLQYSGIGLWGLNYPITGPTDIRYAILPHQGRWDESDIWKVSRQWNEPLITKYTSASSFRDSPQKSLLHITGKGYEVTSVTVDHSDLVVRLFNVAGDSSPHKITFHCPVDKVALVQLNGKTVKELAVYKEKDHSF